MNSDRRAAIQAYCDQTAQQLSQALSALVPPRAAVHLLDFPAYGNVGDSAIYLGQLVLLQRMGLRLATVQSQTSYRPAKLPADRPGLCLLISGGGNFGDLWTHHQDFRLGLLAAFPQSTIIQLPQTIYYRDWQTAKTQAALINRHARFHLMVRDEVSLQLAADLYGASRVSLLPDAAPVLGPLTAPAPPLHPHVLLLRQDLESSQNPMLQQWVQQAGGGGAVQPLDWLEDCHTPAEIRRENQYQRLAHSLAWRFPGWLANELFFRTAQARLRRGLRLLARGEKVVTDRLHAVLLGLLLGKDVLFADNSYGKISNYHRTWIGTQLPWIRRLG